MKFKALITLFNKKIKDKKLKYIMGCIHATCNLMSTIKTYID